MAFGETSTKSRIRAILNFRKPAFRIIIAAILVCAAVCMLSLTVRPAGDGSSEVNEYISAELPKGESYWRADSGFDDKTASLGSMIHFYDFAMNAGLFTLTYDPLSSYLSIGAAEIKDNRIICRTDDGRYLMSGKARSSVNRKYVLTSDRRTSIIEVGNPICVIGGDTMAVAVKAYDAKMDSKKRITLRNALYEYYHVEEFDDGRIILEPRELVAPFQISENSLAMMDQSMKNLKNGKVSAAVDLSAFEE